MNAVRSMLIAAVLAHVGLSVGSAVAGPAPGQLCAAAKKKLAGKEAKALEGCDAKGVVKGNPPSPDCKQKARDSFSAGWDKVESKGGCFTMNDKSTIEGKVTTHVADIESTLDVSGPASACSAGKFRDAGNKAACLLRCHATAQKIGIPLTDPKIAGCLQKCRDKFEAGFTRDETKTPCNTMSDAGTVENKIETFVNDVASSLPTGITTTSTTTSTLPVTTLCCQATGACLDADPDDAPAICQQLHGTVAPTGQVCSGSTGTCGSTKDYGLRCCQCPASSPPFPHPNYCFDSSTSTCGSVCTRFDGGKCGPSSQTCNGP